MTQFGRFLPERCNLYGSQYRRLFSYDCSSAMRKSLIILAKLVLAVLSVAGTGLLILEGWLIWHYEYGIGLPDKDKLAAVSETGGRRKDIAAERRNGVVERMLQSGFINEADAASAKERPLEFREAPSDSPSQQKSL